MGILKKIYICALVCLEQLVTGDLSKRSDGHTEVRKPHYYGQQSKQEMKEMTESRRKEWQKNHFLRTVTAHKPE